MSNIKKYTDLHRLTHGIGDLADDDSSDAVKVVAVGAWGIAGLGLTIAAAVEDNTFGDKEQAVLDIVSGIAQPVADAIEKLNGLGFESDEDEMQMLSSDIVSGLRQIPAYVAGEKLAEAAQSTE